MIKIFSEKLLNSKSIIVGFEYFSVLFSIFSISSVGAITLLGVGYGGAVLLYYTTMGINIG